MFELNVVAFVQDCLCVCVLEFNTLVLDTTVTQVGERMPLYRKCHDAHVDIAWMWPDSSSNQPHLLVSYRLRRFKLKPESKLRHVDKSLELNMLLHFHLWLDTSMEPWKGALSK